MKIAVEMNYTATAINTVDLPEGRTWDDVEDYYVKWGMLYIKFKDMPDHDEYDCSNVVSLESIDFKRPDRLAVFAVDADGDTDFDQLLGEQG